MATPVIVETKRTPVGKAGGSLENEPPENLAAPVLKTLISNTNIQPDMVDEVVLGNAVGPGGNIARLALLTAGFPVDVPGVTIDRQCGSGLEAINYAARFIQNGAGHLYIAGGVESTSLAPWKVERPVNPDEEPRFFSRARFSPDTIGDPEMGIAAENVAIKYGISRKDQDAFALRSHQLASIAQKAGHFEQEIVPIEQADGTIVKHDECPRGKKLENLLPRLRPVFQKDGTVTAGNSCPMNDGAAATLIVSREKAETLGLEPLATFVDAATAGVDPNLLGIGPVPAVNKLLKRNHLTVDDIGLVEFNEAFAAQVIASLHQLQIPWDKVNINGGAIALGHPYGASGGIMIARLIQNMRQQQVQYGIATMGIGGGMGSAVLLRLH
ncbi:acetyl-CoA C-acetyltransferase [Geomicrobium halophilum]|uniref:Acetyl-CoA C-acetyltransferase n=1 Tax=Geomicrobium halophilum TaxID=549000 RepID=A0A841Q002_9BACL|nr:thiolase family protein [Geomicrobium halophilum]MBB6450295.1 acetyl-CoA C-acetyltransferase [Geomicrobium halophilum]